MLKFQNIKTFLLKYTPKAGQKKSWIVVSKIKNTVPWTYVVSDLNGESITGSFYEKEFQKTNQKKFRIEKIIKRKGVINFMQNGKDMTIHLIDGLIKRPWMKFPRIKMSQYVAKPFRSFGENINVKVDLSVHATKTDLENLTRWYLKFCTEKKFSLSKNWSW